MDIQFCVRDSLNRTGSYKKYTGTFGIEIETESLSGYDLPKMKFWNTKGDGSLRDFGVEYISKQPLSFEKELDAALDEFSEKTKSFGLKKESVSTSVHVHINFLEESWKTLANFLVTYTLFENILAEYAGPDRKSNLFCLTMQDAQENIKGVIDLLKAVKNRTYNRIPADAGSMKYAALNISSLKKFGSLEVRLFRGDTDVNIINRWISILNNLLLFSKDKDLTPVQILNKFKVDKERFVSEVFKDNLKHVIYKNYMDDVNKNLFFAAKMATITKDWDTFGVPKVKKVSKDILEANLNELSKKMFNKGLSTLDWMERKVVEEELSRLLQSQNIFLVDSGVDE